MDSGKESLASLDPKKDDAERILVWRDRASTVETIGELIKVYEFMAI